MLYDLNMRWIYQWNESDPQCTFQISKSKLTNKFRCIKIVNGIYFDNIVVTTSQIIFLLT